MMHSALRQAAWFGVLAGAALFAAAYMAARLGWTSAAAWAVLILAVLAGGRSTGLVREAVREAVHDAERSADQKLATAEEENRRLAKERATFEALLESQPDPVIAVDRNLEIVFANRGATRLFRRGTVGPSMDVLRDPALVGLLREGVAADVPIAGTLEVGEEQTRIYQVTVTALSDQTYGIGGAVCVLHDQTALRRLERIRSDFVANVSHELRTPLTAIHGFIETLQNGSYKDPERTVRYLDIMHGETTRLNALITDLLHLSKLEAPESVLNIEPVDMVELAGGVVELYRRPAESKTLTIALEGEPGLPRVRADAALIRQALLNLVDNAIKYTEPKGTVTVRVGRDESGVRVTVSDTGVGIPEYALDRVFERFYRVDKARSRKEGGTGLGLSIVKHTVESHQGKLDIESFPGKGTSIWFSLPVTQRILPRAVK